MAQELVEGVKGRVSIIIPTYRRVPELREAVKSALAQTYPDIEVIVIADGPDAEARAAMEGFRPEPDPRLRYMELAVNSGPAEARNAGLRISTGEWISFLDDDDTMLPEKTAKQMALADTAAPRRMIACRAIYRHGGKHEHREDIWPRRAIAHGEDIADYILRRPSLLGRPGIVPLQALLVHRSILSEVPFTSHPDHEDWAWLLEAWHLAHARISFVWEPLVVYNIATESMSRSRRTNWADSLAWADRYRHWIGNEAYASFLATKVALKARRAGSWRGLRIVAGKLMHSKPRVIDIASLLGITLLPAFVLQRAWKRSLRNEQASFNSL